MENSSSITLFKVLDENVFDLVVKKSKATLPMTIHPTDTFTIHIVSLDTNLSVGSISLVANDKGNIVVSAPLDGKLTVTLNQYLVGTLKSLRGSRANDFYHRPTYYLLLDANTQENGKIVATLNEVSVV